jgi:probable HAF family extracellular repeat protein
VGQSYTSAIADPLTGQPDQHTFLWQDGRMRDIGTLGGNQSLVFDLNNHGQIVGMSTLAGDQQSHPFLWDRGILTDLGTLGGDNGYALWMNEAGAVVGAADLPGSQVQHAFLWQRGVMTDLGTVNNDACSVAIDVNAWGQVVGRATAADCQTPLDGLLWENGTMYDLNALVAPSDLHITQAQNINDRGEIAAYGMFPNGAIHAVLLVPTALAASEGLTSNAPAPGTAGSGAGARPGSATCALVPPWRARLHQRYHLRVC